MTSYERGFLGKCAEYGIDAGVASAMLKASQYPIDPTTMEYFKDVARFSPPPAPPPAAPQAPAADPDPFPADPAMPWVGPPASLAAPPPSTAPATPPTSTAPRYEIPKLTDEELAEIAKGAQLPSFLERNQFPIGMMASTLVPALSESKSMDDVRNVVRLAVKSPVVAKTWSF